MKLFKNNRWLLIPILSSLLLLVLMKTVLFLGYVPTESMEPTLKKDSFILGTRLYGDLTDGDIIIFERDGAAACKANYGIRRRSCHSEWHYADCAGKLLLCSG